MTPREHVRALVRTIVRRDRSLFFFSFPKQTPCRPCWHPVETPVTNQKPLQLFDFEISSSENLAFIPLSVRFHLDQNGLRISLADWQSLPIEARTRLASYAVEDDEDEPEDLIADIGTSEADRNSQAFAAVLIAWVTQYAGHVPAGEAALQALPGDDIAEVPADVNHQCSLAGMSPVQPDEWVRLTRFQRYALAKLSRKATANHDFIPALTEFGLARR